MGFEGAAIRTVDFIARLAALAWPAASKAEAAKEKAAEKKMDDATIEVNVKPATEDATTDLKV